ncbi:TPA: DNA cytosine methyltransferase, partial [Haemophilus influenzae]
TSTAHCLGRNNGQENVLFDISDRRDVVRIQKDGTTPTLTARMGTDGNNIPCMSINQNIRKLTPSECEKLQGFPPGYTQISYRNKPAEDCPDSPRYKAIGNSMAVPVIKWIGERMINYLNK